MSKNLDFLSDFEDAFEYAASGDAAFEVVDLAAGFVDVERPDDDEPRFGGEISYRYRDFLRYVLAEHFDVVFQLSGNRYDRSSLRNSTLHELDDLLVLLLRLPLLHQIDLILQYDDVLQLHDLDCGQMFARLRLRTGLVAGDQEERRVHDGGSVQHGGHEDVVSGTIDETDVTDEPEATRTGRPDAREVVVLRRAAGYVARRTRTFGVVALVDLRVRITCNKYEGSMREIGVFAMGIRLFRGFEGNGIFRFLVDNFVVVVFRV